MYVKSITKENMLSRLVGGKSQEEQDKAEALLTDFFNVIVDQIKFANRVSIKDFGTFEADETILLGRPATYSLRFTPGPKLKASLKHLEERFPTGMPPAMVGAKTGMTHGGKGTGGEDTGL